MGQKQCRMYEIDGKRFPTNAYLALYRIPLTKDNATKLALLVEVLRSGVQMFPDAPVTAIQKTAEELYGALWDIQIVQKGAEAWLSFSLDVLQHVEQEEAVHFLLGMMQKVVCSKELVERQKEILQRRLEAQVDEKRSFAMKRCRELTAKEIVLADGVLEELPQLTAEDMMTFYQEIRSHALLYLFFCGDIEGTQSLRQWKKQLDLYEETQWECKTILPVIQPVQKVCEHTNGVQARLVLGFVTEIAPYSLDMLALQVFCELFGGSNGLLFQELREKQGLCYDISMSCDPWTGLAFIQMGIESTQIKQAVIQICGMIQHLQKQKVSEKIFAYAVQQVARWYQNICDNPWQMINFVVEQTVFETGLSLEEFLHRLSVLEAEDMSRIANKLYLQTIYTQMGEGAEPWER